MAKIAKIAKKKADQVNKQNKEQQVKEARESQKDRLAQIEAEAKEAITDIKFCIDDASNIGNYDCEYCVSIKEQDQEWSKAVVDIVSQWLRKEGFQFDCFISRESRYDKETCSFYEIGDAYAFRILWRD